MARVVVDANILIGAALERDAQHEMGLQIVHSFDHGDLPKAEVTNYVLAEVLNIVAERADHGAGVNFLDRLIESGGFEIVHLRLEDFRRGQVVFRENEGVSFVDSITTGYMQRKDLEYLYSFDDDFDRFDQITRLNTAVNPYR